MEKEKKNIREPYEPENTPTPPQIIDPEKREDRKHPVNEDDAPRGQQDRSTERPGKDEKGHLLSERADIDDETTI